MGTILIVFVIILELKVLRDIVAFRFERSWLSKLPKWIQKWLRGWYTNSNYAETLKSFDGWHCFDASIIAVTWLVTCKLVIGDWWIGVLLYPLFWLIFYQLFNFQFHFLWMLPEYREHWLFR